MAGYSGSYSESVGPSTASAAGQSVGGLYGTTSNLPDFLKGRLSGSSVDNAEANMPMIHGLLMAGIVVAFFVGRRYG